jgi:hypothetical protein
VKINFAVESQQTKRGKGKSVTQQLEEIMQPGPSEAPAAEPKAESEEAKQKREEKELAAAAKADAKKKREEERQRQEAEEAERLKDVRYPKVKVRISNMTERNVYGVIGGVSLQLRRQLKDAEYAGRELTLVEVEAEAMRFEDEALTAAGDREATIAIAAKWVNVQ